MLKSIIRFVSVYISCAAALCILASCASLSSKTAGTFAPAAASYSEGIIQVYSARTWGAKKALAVHTWISVKKSDAVEYTSYEIIGWRLKRNGTALVKRTGNPDRDWWGNHPTLLLDKRGSDVDTIIDKIALAVEQYPYQNQYHAWPGPNSNTFTAFIGKEVPELALDLPSTAIGKNYRELAGIIGTTPSGTGLQASLWGLLGISAGYEEGLEFNILGLNFELDIFDFAIELPGIGRVGPAPTALKPEQPVIPSKTISPAADQ